MQPTQNEIDRISEILLKSIKKLIKKDSNIFNIGIDMPQQYSEDAKILNRELHETTINHRLAYYIENKLKKNDWKIYNVDIEYNRFYENPKMLKINNIDEIIRPDIIVHSRMNNNINPQHLLVVEAKKGAISNHDINKIEHFISDNHYNYLFGLSISYCSSNSSVLSNLYYREGNNIISKELNVKK
jgi:hypothetical protein